MKTLARLTAAAVFTAGLVAASSVFAAPAVGMLKLDNANAWGPGSAGGPFQVTTMNLPGGNGTFLTFCIERRESIRQGTWYDANLSTEAKFNGNGTTDPVGIQTAYLYTAFRNGTLDDKASAAGFAWAYGNLDGYTDTDGSALQDAIWYLENELGSVSGLALKLVNLANANATTLGNVRVINVWDKGTLPRMDSQNARQDVLVIVPTPEALVGGLGLLGVIAAARLRRRDSVL